MTAAPLNKGVISRQIPSSWDIASLRWISRRYAGGTPDRNNPEFWIDGNIPWVNSGAVNQGIIREASAFVTQAALKGGATRWVPRGALLIALAGQGKTKGMVAQTDIDTTCNQSMAAICPNERVYGRFLLWWLISQYRNIRGLAGDDLRDGLNLDIVGSIPVPLPPMNDQRAIAAFLDRETARIDALIEKKRRQIELLQEKRTALISHAVTKGLDRKAPMKESGIEWLGEIPATWEIRRLKNVASCNDEALPEDTEPEFDLLYVDIGSVDPSSGIIRKEELRFESAPSRARRRVKRGDVIISTVRTYLRAIAPIIHPEPNLIVSTGFAVIRPRMALYPGFAAHALRAPYFVDAVVARSVGVSYPAINASELISLPIVLPPLNEQRAIAAHLDSETERIDALVQKINLSIDRLREYRAALISAAVTGKLDVREEVA